MKKLAMIIMIFVAISCSENNDDNPEIATVNALGIEISITDGNGNDLLDPNNPNAFLEENIRLYYKVNGQVEEVYDSHLTHPRHFLVFQHESEYRIRVFLNEKENATQTITYIKWNATDTDTIKAELRRWGASNVAVDEVWYNGGLKNSYYFEIVK